MIRVLILIKQAKREFTLLLYPNAVSPITVGDAAIPNHIVFAVLEFFRPCGGLCSARYRLGIS